MHEDDPKDVGEHRALKHLDSYEITAIMAKIGCWIPVDRNERLPLNGTQWINVLAG